MRLAPPQSGAIINLAPTGLVATKRQSPHLPVSAREIVDDVARCAARGATIVHLHARGRDGRPTWRKESYARLIGGIRERFPGLVICVSLSGRVHGRFSQRADVLRLDGDLRPDLASLTLGSLNFARDASVNSPAMIRRLAERMAERGVKPELEVFDLGMLACARDLIGEGLLRPPHYFNLILGNLASAQARPAHLGQLLADLPPDTVWTAAGIGGSQLAVNTLGLLFGNGARTGLEDARWFDAGRRVPASNEMLVERVARLAEIFGRRLAAPPEVRAQLGLPVAAGAIRG